MSTYLVEIVYHYPIRLSRFYFNSAFDTYGDVTAYDPDIFTRLPQFVSNNLDLLPNLKRTPEFLATDPYLTQTQKDEVMLRAAYLVSLAN